MRFKSKLQNSELTLKNSEVKKLKNEIDLKALIGWDEGDLTIPPVTEKKMSIFITFPTGLDLSKHYEVRITELDKKINELNVEEVNKKYWPEVFLNAGVSYHWNDFTGSNRYTYNSSSNSFVSSDRYTDWSVQLKLQYNLLDWGVKRRELEIAKINYKVKDMFIASKIRDVKRIVDQLSLDLTQLKQTYELQSQLAQLENKNYNSIEVEYRNGRVTFLDLVKAEEDYINAENQRYRYFYQLSLTGAEYQYHQGKLYESLMEL